MNYQQHYNLLIERAKNRDINSKTETHHIVPRCMNGSDDKSNLVELTPEEHFLAHQLLVKIYPDNYSLVFAAHMMTVSNSGHVRSNKRYGWLRKLHAEALSKINTGRRASEETKIKMSISKKGKSGNKHTEETKIKIGKLSAGRNHTEETKTKIAKSNTGSVRTEETKQKMSLSSLGKPKSEEAKKNMSAAKKGQPSPRKCQKTGIVTAGAWKKGNIPWNKGLVHPCKEDTKMKIKEANSGRKRQYKEDGSWIMIKGNI